MESEDTWWAEVQAREDAAREMLRQAQDKIMEQLVAAESTAPVKYILGPDGSPYKAEGGNDPHDLHALIGAYQRMENERMRYQEEVRKQQELQAQYQRNLGYYTQPVSNGSHTHQVSWPTPEDILKTAFGVDEEEQEQEDPGPQFEFDSF